MHNEILTEKQSELLPYLKLFKRKFYLVGGTAIALHKWKDYVDLYFIIRDHYAVTEISREANKNFGQFFSEKLFREQMAFHKDIDYSEHVEYLINPPSEDEIRSFLIEKAIDLER